VSLCDSSRLCLWHCRATVQPSVTSMAAIRANWVAESMPSGGERLGLRVQVLGVYYRLLHSRVRVQIPCTGTHKMRARWRRQRAPGNPADDARCGNPADLGLEPAPCSGVASGAGHLKQLPKPNYPLVPSKINKPLPLPSAHAQPPAFFRERHPARPGGRQDAQAAVAPGPNPWQRRRRRRRHRRHQPAAARCSP